MLKTSTKFGAAMLLAMGLTTAHAQVSLLPKVDYAAGTGSVSVAIGDLNGDGKLDFAVANQTSSTVSVFTGSGTSFGTKVDYTTGTTPRSVAIGDLNGDGKLDLVVANFGSNSVSVLTGTGTSFGTKKDYATGSGPYSVAIGDFNGDDKMDLAVANNNSNNVSVLTGTGTSFGTKKDYGTGLNPQSVAIGDLNGDGKMDIVVGNASSNTVSVFTGTGTGSFGSNVEYVTGSGNPRSVAIGDLNEDGRKDLVVANENTNKVTVLTGTVTGFLPKVDYSTGSRPYNVAIGDLNGDGKMDLAVANYGGNTVSVLTATGSGFATKVDYGTGTGPISVAIGDLNGDGKMDLAVANITSDNASTLINTTCNKPVIVSNPIPQLVCNGLLATFTVSATGDNLSYIWSNGMTTSTITSSVVGDYFVTVSGTCGKAEAEGVSLSTGLPTVIVTQPVSQTVCGSVFATFSVSATGTNLSYIWSNVTNSIEIASNRAGNNRVTAKAPEISNTTFTSNVAGNYQVTVKGSCGDVISNTVSLVNKICEATSTIDDFSKASSIQLFPNPTTGDFTIANTTLGATVQVYNSQGLIVFDQKLVSESTLVNAVLSKGIYLVRAGNATRKLIIE